MKKKCIDGGLWIGSDATCEDESKPRTISTTSTTTTTTTTTVRFESPRMIILSEYKLNFVPVVHQ